MGRKTDKKLWISVGMLALAVAGIIFVSQVGITPTDTKIIDLLHENGENLLGVVGVVGAGIARDENNHIMGIAVYVDDNVADAQQIPSNLGEFTVYVKDVAEASDFERERMIIQNKYYRLLNVTTNKTLYQQNEDFTVTIKNDRMRRLPLETPYMTYALKDGMVFLGDSTRELSDWK